ncbi:hypothetical protein IAQ61_011190 [Plenodomus lingam]|uniref:uncharacterized protein n=1 Tax=Leptosphaeria maculans TaxID=5022 RepID=UPI003329E4C6|nr:hypothetical protein IAQ61_011190 [Plenodomus lingam]
MQQKNQASLPEKNKMENSSADLLLRLIYSRIGHTCQALGTPHLAGQNNDSGTDTLDKEETS